MPRSIGSHNSGGSSTTRRSARNSARKEPTAAGVGARGDPRLTRMTAAAGFHSGIASVDDESSGITAQPHESRSERTLRPRSGQGLQHAAAYLVHRSDAFDAV